MRSFRIKYSHTVDWKLTRDFPVKMYSKEIQDVIKNHSNNSVLPMQRKGNTIIIFIELNRCNIKEIYFTL